MAKRTAPADKAAKAAVAAGPAKSARGRRFVPGAVGEPHNTNAAPPHSLPQAAPCPGTPVTAERMVQLKRQARSRKTKPPEPSTAPAQDEDPHR